MVRLDNDQFRYVVATPGAITDNVKGWPLAKLPWLVDHPVLEVLRARRTDRTDKHKIGLAVEGGGMRGVVSGAMLCALEDLGLPAAAFDGVYGCSSGATNCAYFIAGDSWYPLSIYYDDLRTREFVDFRRAFTSNILNLDYAFETVVELVKPLDYKAVLSASTPLHVAITDVDDVRTVTFSDFESKDDLKSALRASSWLPVAVRGAAEFRGRRVVDGGVLTAHPYELALADGCTHVLSMSTRRIQPPPTRNGAGQYVAYRHLERLKAGLGKDYLREVRDYRRKRQALQSRMLTPGDAPYVLDLAPLPWMPNVKRHEMDPGRLINSARNAYELMFCAIEGIDPDEIRTGNLRAIPRFTVVRKRDAPSS
jgi:predicted patatin/cPLA2 family phospholipase